MTAPDILHVPLHCPLAEAYRDSVGVIGNLDGVHLGHQALVREAAAFAGEQAKPLTAIVFEPHPRQFFAPDTAPFLLTSLPQKAYLLKDLGVSRVLVLPFNGTLASQTPEEFVCGLLDHVLGLSGIVCGADFRFGHDRTGTAETLTSLARNCGMAARIVIPVMNEIAAEKFSSSQARNALREGRPEEAARILGRPWSVTGSVEEGRKLGRTLNFPTANIRLDQYVEPARGVYAVTALLDGRSLKGVANFGARPTVDGEGTLLEVHLFDFDGDLYGREMTVAFHHFLRPERKFDGLDALKTQIAADGEQAARLLAQK